MKELLYGHDTESNIVAIEPVPGKALVQIFKREDGKLISRYEKNWYYLFFNEKHPDAESADLLLGDNYYNRIKHFDNLADYYAVKGDVYKPYLNCQYLVATGKTLFKDMDITDPLIFYFDLEVYTNPDYKFVNASRESDRIIIIAVRCSDGREWVITHENERDLLNEFITLFRKVDPDIVANHNIFNFDLKYLSDRCKLHNVKLALGRNGTEPNIFDTKIKFADRERDYTNFDIYGRHVIDTMFLAEYADVVLRNMPGYGLKELVKYLGKASDSRTYIEGKDISHYWDNNREELLKYALDDVREAEILYKQFAVPYFMVTKMVPMSYQQVFRYGTGGQVDLLFVREYYRQKASLPKANPKRSFVGGFAGVLEYGLIKEPLIYADVESLYPSLGKLLKIQPKKDFLGLYQKILNLLIDYRFENKYSIAKLKEQADREPDKKEELLEEASRRKATDGSVKILLNTMSFGWLGWSFGMFNDYDEAERITLGGQKILKDMIRLTEQAGGRPVKADTDGLLLVVPEKYRSSKDKELEFCQWMSDNLPDGIRIGLDGRYQAAIAFDGKSYVLHEYDDSLTIKGNTLRGRNVEPFAAVFIKNTIRNLLNEKYDDIKQEYAKLGEKIKLRSLTGEDIVKRNSLNMSLEEYNNRVDAGGTNRAAAYELAIKSDKHYAKGDVIYHYVKELDEVVEIVRNKPVLRKPKVPAFQKAEMLDNYNYDYEVEHYKNRLDKVVKKFIILGPEIFETLFPVEIKNEDRKRYLKLTGKEYAN